MPFATTVKTWQSPLSEFIIVFAIVRIDPEILHIVGKHSTPSLFFFQRQESPLNCSG